MWCLAMKSAFHGQPLFFEIQNQRVNRRRRAARKRRAPLTTLGEKDECDVRFASLRLQLSQLVFFKGPIAKIAPNKFKERRRHEFLQDEEEVFSIARVLGKISGIVRANIRLNGNEAIKIHSLLMQWQR